MTSGGGSSMKHTRPTLSHRCEDTYKGKKYKYLLVVTDAYNKRMDAEPYTNLKQDSHEVLDALKKNAKEGY